MTPRQLSISVIVMLAIAIAMGVLVWRTRKTNSAIQTAQTNSAPVAPPVSGPTEQVTLYAADDDSGVLRPIAARVPLASDRQQRGEQTLQALVKFYSDKSSHHVLAEGSEIRAFYLVEPGLAVIDLNGAFANGHRSGVLVESLTIASLAKTLSANLPDITQIEFLVDGKPRETLAGHADLSGVYDVSSLNQLADQLQNGQ
ncbi:MAG TPA: GerMN domain-containing protein [Terriglobales bacterium]